MDIGPELANVARLTFIAMLILDLLVTLFGEFGMPHASEVAAQAAHEISHGRYKSHFWSGSIVLGHRGAPDPALARLAHHRRHRRRRRHGRAVLLRVRLCHGPPGNSEQLKRDA